MNYKDLFQKIVRLLLTPGKFWNEVDTRNVQTNFVFPLIGICGLAEFAGTLLRYDGMPGQLFQWALTNCCAVAVALFGGFFLSEYLMTKIDRKWFGNCLSREKAQAFVGYSMVVTFVTDIVCGLYSVIILKWILQLYTISIVFEGARSFIKVPEKRLTAYTVAASAVILLSPAVIKLIFNELRSILD